MVGLLYPDLHPSQLQETFFGSEKLGVQPCAAGRKPGVAGIGPMRAIRARLCISETKKLPWAN